MKRLTGYDYTKLDVVSILQTSSKDKLKLLIKQNVLSIAQPKKLCVTK